MSEKVSEQELRELAEVFEYWLKKDFGINPVEKGIDCGDIYFYYISREPFGSAVFEELDRMARYTNCDFSFTVFPHSKDELWIELRFTPWPEEDEDE